MTSQRHIGEPVLDAARESVLDVGVRRTTLTDVARRAGISRMTLYRRYADVSTLFSDLIVREFSGVIAAAAQQARTARTARERLVAESIAAIRGIHANPLFAKVLQVEPELLLPYVLDRIGANQQMALDRFGELIDSGHADGSIRPGETKDQALTLLLIVQSFVLSSRPIHAHADPERLHAELATALSAYLAPGS